MNNLKKTDTSIFPVITVNIENGVNILNTGIIWCSYSVFDEEKTNFLNSLNVPVTPVL